MIQQRCPMLVETGDLDNRSAALDGELDVDACIVGGGYLGLWTAIRLRDEAPSLSIAVVEADICGGGASGRDSGMALPLWSKIEALVEQCGVEEALRLCHESQAAIQSIADFADANDIEFARVGWIWGSTCPRHDGRWNPIFDALFKFGETPFEILDKATLNERVRAPGYRCGVFDASAATIQPAKLVRGLRRVALARGVTIFENTPMTRLVRAVKPAVETPEGRITAAKVVLAMNAWSTRIPELNRGIFVITSDDAISSPAGDVLDQQGWRDGPIITNSNTFVSSYRTTRDGRVVAGVTGGAIRFARLTRERFDGPSPRARCGGCVPAGVRTRCRHPLRAKLAWAHRPDAVRPSRIRPTRRTFCTVTGSRVTASSAAAWAVKSCARLPLRKTMPGAGVAWYARSRPGCRWSRSVSPAPIWCEPRSANRIASITRTGTRVLSHGPWPTSCPAASSPPRQPTSKR